MVSLPFLPALTSAHTVFSRQHGTVSRLARQRGVFRQTVYREAYAVRDALDPQRHAGVIANLRQQVADLQAEVQSLREPREHAVLVGPDKQAEFVATAQALGVSLSSAWALLKVLLGDAVPSVSRLGRWAKEAGQGAHAALEVMDAYAHTRARQVAADEIFVGSRLVLMTVEQQSLCWLGGRLSDSRGGDEWEAEFKQFPNAEQVTRDGGKGLRHGLARVNKQRARDSLPLIADQEDHFHLVYRLRKGLRGVRAKAQAAYRKAEQVLDRAEKDRRKGKLADGRWPYVASCWHQAERAFDRWSAQERAINRLRAGLRLFTPDGELNTPARAEAEVQAALAELTGPEWDLWKRRRIGPETFTFLARVHERLRALPIPAELRDAALRVEGLKREPGRLRGDGPSAGALRGVLLAFSLVLSLSGEAGVRAVTRVREVLAGAWRSSSLVENLNSVLRMQQGRQKRMTQGLLDLKRLYWNSHTFVAGCRKRTSPYGRLGIKLPEGGWWQVIKTAPEQLRQELSALNQAA